MIRLPTARFCFSRSSNSLISIPFLDLEDARWNFHKVAREGFYLKLDGEIRFITSVIKSGDRCISLALSTGKKCAFPRIYRKKYEP